MRRNCYVINKYPNLFPYCKLKQMNVITDRSTHNTYEAIPV